MKSDDKSSIELGIKEVVSIFLIAFLVFSTLSIITAVLNTKLLCMPPQALQAIIGGYGVIIVACLGFGFRKKKKKNDADDCPTTCKKGVNYYEKREKTDLIKQLENITLHGEITILTIHLTPINELFGSPNVKESISKNKPVITIYALNPESNDIVLNELYHLYSKYKSSEDLKNGLIKAHNHYNDEIKPFYETNNVTINLKFLNIDEKDIPIPPFQWYEVNKFVYFNPLVTLYIHDENNFASIDELNIKNTPRDGLHLVFNPDNENAQKLLSDYRKTLKYYETKCVSE